MSGAFKVVAVGLAEDELVELNGRDAEEDEPSQESGGHCRFTERSEKVLRHLRTGFLKGSSLGRNFAPPYTTGGRHLFVP
jgi:hypothetical protein